MVWNDSAARQLKRAAVRKDRHDPSEGAGGGLAVGGGALGRAQARVVEDLAAPSASHFSGTVPAARWGIASIVVFAPLPNIPPEVVKAPGIGLEDPYRSGPHEII